MLGVPNWLQLPPSDKRSILIAGCGGGFDVFNGLPIALALMTEGHSVTLANLSFSQLAASGCEKVARSAWRIKADARELPYFPEKWLAEWLAQKGLKLPVYAFERTGAVPLIEAYQAVVREREISLVILVDGGTDSIIFGDEPGLGTIVEDAVSLTAAVAVCPETLLISVGFGVDHFHGVSHYSFLENVATLIRDRAFLGTTALLAGTPEVESFLALVEYANRRQPHHVSIVCNSIASAIRGEFGDVHASKRTERSELFINPLMALMWAFRAADVAGHMLFAEAVSCTTTAEEAVRAIELAREFVKPRLRRSIPL